MGLIYNPNYFPPQPIPHVEAMVRKELQRIDHLLDILWVPDVYPNGAQGVVEGRYGLICRWPKSDGRWKLVREEGYTDAFDLLGWFCEDMDDASTVPNSPETMMQLVYERLGNADNEAAPWYDRMKQVFGKNIDLMRERKNVLDETVEEMAEEEWVTNVREGRPVSFGGI